MVMFPQQPDLYWKRPPSRDKGDANLAIIHQAMGGALTLWEGIEYLFVTIFCHFIEPRVSNAAARAYGAIASSKGRMDALDSASEVYFRLHGVAKELTDDYSLLRKHFDKARGLRNDIAHAVTMDFQFAGGDDAAGIFLIPAMYGSGKNLAFASLGAERFDMVTGKYRFTAADIYLITGKFGHLQQEVLKWHGRFATAHPHFEPK